MSCHCRGVGSAGAAEGALVALGALGLKLLHFVDDEAIPLDALDLLVAELIVAADDDVDALERGRGVVLRVEDLDGRAAVLLLLLVARPGVGRAKFIEPAGGCVRVEEAWLGGVARGGAGAHSFSQWSQTLAWQVISVGPPRGLLMTSLVTIATPIIVFPRPGSHTSTPRPFAFSPPRPPSSSCFSIHRKAVRW